MSYNPNDNDLMRAATGGSDGMQQADANDMQHVKTKKLNPKIIIGAVIAVIVVAVVIAIVLISSNGDSKKGDANNGGQTTNAVVFENSPEGVVKKLESTLNSNDIEKAYKCFETDDEKLEVILEDLEEDEDESLELINEEYEFEKPVKSIKDWSIFAIKAELADAEEDIVEDIKDVKKVKIKIKIKEVEDGDDDDEKTVIADIILKYGSKELATNEDEEIPVLKDDDGKWRIDF